MIDRLLEEDPYLALPTQPTEGVSLSECRRRDLFTENEKRILAAFATRPRHALNLDEARRLGGEEGIRELRERAYAAEAYGQFRLSVPLFNEYLRSHPLDFADYLSGAETVP